MDWRVFTRRQVLFRAFHVQVIAYREPIMHPKKATCVQYLFCGQTRTTGWAEEHAIESMAGMLFSTGVAEVVPAWVHLDTCHDLVGCHY